MIKVLGHRGCAGLEPENTIRAFKRALDLGVDLIEFDVRTTWHDVVKKIKEVEPKIKTGAILAGRPINPILIAREAKTNLLCLRHEFIDKATVRNCHKNDIEINAWTVNEMEDIERMIKLGVDIISSDYPNRILGKLSRKNKTRHKKSLGLPA